MTEPETRGTADTPGTPGKRIVLPIVMVILAGTLLVVMYLNASSGDLPQHMKFENLDAVPENATVLEMKLIKKENPFLEAHLRKSADVGLSTEAIGLRVDAMRRTLLDKTGHAGPEWVVAWEGKATRITYALGTA